MKKIFILITLGIITGVPVIIYLKNLFSRYEKLVNSPWVSKIHTITYKSGVTYTYNYEKPVETGRLLSVKSSDNSFSIDFDYTAHTATQVMGTTTTVIPLTAQGFSNLPALTIESLSDDPNPVTGYCTFANDGVPPDKKIYNGGNLVREYRQNADSTYKNDWGYTYTSDYNAVENYWGLQTKYTNWIRTQTDNTVTDENHKLLFTFTYTYDAFHRVKTQTRTNNNDHTSEVTITNIEYYQL